MQMINPNNDNYPQQFASITAFIVEFIKPISAPNFIWKAGPEKWSIAEILEHLNISDKSGYIAMLKPMETPTADRIEAMEKRFSGMVNNDNLSFAAPPAAEPKGKFLMVEQGLAEFLKTRTKITDFIAQNNLSLLAGGFEHPRLGYLTRQQWLRFLIWHSEHHFKQIKNTLIAQNQQ
jgi:hypothetical protein